jgi:hypothetical protein
MPPWLDLRQQSPSEGTRSDARHRRSKWKPGNYVRRCHECDERFRGDGQAQTCADCAYAMETTA